MSAPPPVHGNDPFRVAGLVVILISLAFGLLTGAAKAVAWVLA
ncbi:hypothetical protein [Sphingomonas sp. KC8]|nr:hypothetical protein [Sphingomonas sp. KC8]ARS29059.1 hypothetical protein KC8_17455 [Sphingomonas sp. KC8]